MQKKLMALALSGRFIGAVATGIFALLHDQLGVQISERAVMELVGLVGALVVGTSIREFGETFAAAFTSRRFWVFVGGTLFTLASEFVGLPISEETVMELVILLGAWIVGDSVRKTE